MNSFEEKATHLSGDLKEREQLIREKDSLIIELNRKLKSKESDTAQAEAVMRDTKRRLVETEKNLAESMKR
ncbi:unnamed protein product [Protopolystoma xenopodis]|uniref:Myosin tail domain-containing protein n=1 Tax=Protopolystoma xenopodis TaxID=117903 RepID=A0A3S5CP71_9PLAT|nr:unnamed protein product [Protopolystoma xenopodis]